MCVLNYEIIPLIGKSARSANGYPIIFESTTWKICIYKGILIIVLFNAAKLVWCLWFKKRQWMVMEKLWRLRLPLKFTTIDSRKFTQEIKQPRMWHGVHLKSAKNQRMNNSFAVNSINNSLLHLWPERGESSTKKWMETLTKP